MTFLDIKAANRRRVHATFAVPCLYYAPETTSGVDITARLHNRNVVGGDIDSGGYASVIEGVTRIIFNREELDLAEVAPVRLGKVQFPNYNGEGQDVYVVLDNRDPYDGPITEKWTVSPGDAGS